MRYKGCSKRLAAHSEKSSKINAKITPRWTGFFRLLQAGDHLCERRLVRLIAIVGELQLALDNALCVKQRRFVRLGTSAIEVAVGRPFQAGREIGGNRSVRGRISGSVQPFDNAIVIKG